MCGQEVWSFVCILKWTKSQIFCVKEDFLHYQKTALLTILKRSLCHYETERPGFSGSQHHRNFCYDSALPSHLSSCSIYFVALILFKLSSEVTDRQCFPVIRSLVSFSKFKLIFCSWNTIWRSGFKIVKKHRILLTWLGWQWFSFLSCDM